MCTCTCVGIDAGRDVEVAEGVGVVRDVVVSFVGPQLAGQQLGVGHQGGRSSASPTQVLEVVDRLNRERQFLTLQMQFMFSRPTMKWSVVF